MQAASQFHGDIVKALLGVPEHLLDDAAALDARDDVLNDHADARNEPVGFLVLLRELASARLLFGLVDCDTGQLVPLEGTVAVKLGTVWKARPFLVADLLVVLLAFMDGSQVLDLPVLQAAHQVVLHGVAFFLPL